LAVEDDSGFREFVDLHYVDLLRVAYLITGSTHDAEDLVQSALLKVMRRWGKVDDPLPYLRRTMINHHLSLWRRLRSREVVIAYFPEQITGDGADRVVQRQALLAALRELPARTRVVVVLRYVADMPEAEVAAALGWPAGTVKSHASRGLARLHAALGTDDSRTTEGQRR
jgi:RNA polymerase sigma-70 factor (sigma-E family)